MSSFGSEREGMVRGPMSLGKEKLRPEFLSLWESRPLGMRQKGLGCGNPGLRVEAGILTPGSELEG